MGRDQDMNPTVNYTLPGIMQYLQSQFTQVERNRLQGELERSSLKLKIIELENERNSLLRKSEKLQITVDQLTQELYTLKGNVDNSKTNGDVLEKNSKKSDTEIDGILGGIHSVDVSKLVHARKFLKSATNEILYLLKTPTVELENTSTVGSVTGVASLTGADNENDLFYNYNTLNNSHQLNDSLNNTERNNIVKEIDQPLDRKTIEKDLNEMLAAPFQSNSDSNNIESDAETIIEHLSAEEKNINNGINPADNDSDDDSDDDDDDFDDDDFDDDDDDDFDDDDFDVDDDDVDNENGNTKQHRKKSNSDIKNEKDVGAQHVKHQKEKLLTLLKKNTKKVNDSPPNTLAVELYPNLSEIELKSGILFAYYDKANVVKIYDDLLGKGNMIKEIHLPEANTIVDIVTNESFILITTTDSLVAYTIDPKVDLKIVRDNMDAKSIDLDSNKILLVSNSKIEILEIDLENKKFSTISSFDYFYEGTLKKAKFVKNNPSFDVSVLSSNNLYLFNTTDENTTSKLIKSLPLNQYHEWLITSRNMILRFDNGLFLFDFSVCSEFKTVPLPSFPDSEHASNSISEVISPCADDDTMFYITRCSSPKTNTHAFGSECNGLYELRLFKIIDTGDILEIKNLTDLNGSDCYCVGKVGDNYSICVIKGEEILLHSILK